MREDSGGAVVGIDLGTSNTVVAHVGDGRARALRDEDTKDVLIPSIASFHPSGAVLVGHAAKDRRIIDSKSTIFSAKRLIGRAWSSPQVAQARVRLPYELREGKNQSVEVFARNQVYTLPEISAFVLRKAKAVAEVSLGTKVDRAVITCPANFDELQREATKLAGKLAGLEVLRILNEPTAAALAYGYGKNNEERILIYDFGGGTFDVTILELSSGIFRVKATSGDMYLGGDDVDYGIAQRIAEAFARKHFYDPRGDKQVFEHVRVAAEQIKMKLSTQAEAEVELRDVMFGVGGKSLDMTFPMSRRELDEIVAPYIDRTLKVCLRALEIAHMGPRDFDQIILVGGSTRIPQVRERVAEMFGREPAGDVSPDEAVAIGAAIQGMAMTEARAEAATTDGEAPTDAARTSSREILVERKPVERVGERTSRKGLAVAAAVSISAPTSIRPTGTSTPRISVPRIDLPPPPPPVPTPALYPASRPRPPLRAETPPASSSKGIVWLVVALVTCLALLVGLGLLLRALT